MKIFLDCGHGGSDPGAVHGGLIEKNMTLVCAKAACELLKRNGQTVMLSRTDDRYMTLNERAKMANAWGADAFISFHFNAGGGSRGEVIHSVYGGKGKELAEKIAEQIKRLGPRTERIYSNAGSSGNGD